MPFLPPSQQRQSTEGTPIISKSTGSIFRIGTGAMAVEDQSEISFSNPRGTLPWQPIFVGFIHRTNFRHASG